MNAISIKDAINSAVASRGCFIVDVSVSKDNDVTVTIESEASSVDIDDCEAISNTFEAAFDRQVEDYSLTVTSAGLDQPFKTYRQYQKAVGSEVEVSFKGGRRIVALLCEAPSEDSVVLEYSVLEAVEGKKKKEKVLHRETFSLNDDINSIRPHIEL